MIQQPQKIKLIWNNVNRKRYVKKGYEFTAFGDEFYIDVFDLPEGSHTKVNIICDECGKIMFRSYRTHSEFDTCMKCSRIKTRRTNLEKYGVEYPMQSKEIQKKSEQTNLKKYGVKHVLQNDEIYQKVKETNLKKFGVEYLSQNKEIYKKITKTNLERYGVKRPLQNKECQKKMEQTCIDRYGTPYPSKTEEIKELSKQRNLDKYGTEFAVQSDKIQQKIKNTCLEKYGVEYAIQSQEVKDKIQNTILDKYGVDNAMKNPDVVQKMRQTNLVKYGKEFYVETEDFKEKQTERLQENGNLVPWSKPQKRINDLVNGHMNYYQMGYFLDIALCEEKIDIEYDGSGHDLNVKYGKISQEEFQKKEELRDNRLTSAGWKIIRLKSKRDKLPSDEDILKTIKDCIKQLENTNIICVEWD